LLLDLIEKICQSFVLSFVYRSLEEWYIISEILLDSNNTCQPIRLRVLSIHFFKVINHGNVNHWLRFKVVLGHKFYHYVSIRPDSKTWLANLVNNPSTRFQYLNQNSFKNFIVFIFIFCLKFFENYTMDQYLSHIINHLKGI
jgi:hypothetical protein